VNAGPAQAARTRQRALALRADGNMRDVTRAAVKAHCGNHAEATIVGMVPPFVFRVIQESFRTID
jgi:lysozyme family protein